LIPLSNRAYRRGIGADGHADTASDPVRNEIVGPIVIPVESQS